MARAPRVHIPGAWYHVTARGNERRAIFRAEADYLRMMLILEESIARYGLRLHGYVLMENHYHLILEAPEGNLSRAMQWLNVRYSTWFNRRHRRIGHLFQGRFRAIIVDPQEWGLPWAGFKERRGDPRREMVFWLARCHAGMTLGELGACAGGTDYGAVAMALKRFELKMENDEKLRKEMQKLEERMFNVNGLLPKSCAES